MTAVVVVNVVIVTDFVDAMTVKPTLLFLLLFMFLILLLLMR